MSNSESLEFARETNVSRETLDKLELFAGLLIQWNPRVNLVSKDSLKNLWRRHIADSAQLREIIPAYDGALVDVGSGAGFPGMVLAIMGLRNIYLIESNERKCVFLQEVARKTGCSVTVHNTRLGNEGVKSSPKLPKAEIITARAVTRLDKLLDIVYPLVYDRTCCIFHKGSRVDEELCSAQNNWQFSLEQLPSKSDPSGAILKLSNIRRRDKNGGFGVEK